jgi:hypothetical protein
VVHSFRIPLLVDAEIEDHNLPVTEICQRAVLKALKKVQSASEHKASEEAMQQLKRNRRR